MKQRIHLLDLLQVFIKIFCFFLFLKIDQLNEIRHVTLSSILCQTVENINEIQIDAFRMANNFE